MHRSLALDPLGRLRVVEDSTNDLDAADIDGALVDAFEQSSARGLLLLASERASNITNAQLVYWRDFARRLFREICRLGEGSADRWESVPPPAEIHLQHLVDEAPPMRGLEYLSPAILRDLWHQLAELVSNEAAQFPEGPAGYLHVINPLWHLLGRVTFHLAENKRDAERPFAFLATFTHRMSSSTKLQHLPLAEALRTYASAGDRDKLELLLEPVRRAARTSALVAAMLDNKSLFTPHALTVRQAYRFLSESPRMEEAGLVVRVPDWWSARKPPRPQVQVRIGTKPSEGAGMDSLLDFEVDVALDGEPLTAAERQQLLESAENLVLLRGKWVEVDRDQLNEVLDHWKRLQAAHANGINFLHGMRLLSGVQLEEGHGGSESVNAWTRITAGDWLRETLEQLRNPQGAEDCHPGRDLSATLRPYQEKGVAWLWFMTRLGLGACLADDMGLGKTIQIIDLLLQIRRTATASATATGKTRQPSLLVVPASLLGNWRGELTRFAPTLSVFFAHRSESDAASIEQVAANPEKELANYDLVVTTYGLVRRDTWLAQRTWHLVILDEGQAIRNAAAAQTRSVKSLRSNSRIVCTGTPVENHLGDLWSIFDFCCPGLLGNASQFKKFIKRTSEQQDANPIGALRKLVRPYILRRLKTDPNIAPDLPDKTEMRADCGLTKQQAALYQRTVEQLSKRLEHADGMERRGLVLATLMHLKQICNHPDQFLQATAFDPEASSKFQRLRFLCEPIAERQEKALVFTQFQSMTEPLADLLATVFGSRGLVLHGGTPVKKRQQLVKQFQEDQAHPYFVISLKAGGSGLNLTAASHVIHFDRWWNPAVENQATDRAFRIGQKRNVLVHKFVCRGTVEERIDAMIRDKRALADELLNEQGDTLLTEMSNDELLRFVSLDLSRATSE